MGLEDSLPIYNFLDTWGFFFNFLFFLKFAFLFLGSVVVKAQAASFRDGLAKVREIAK